MNKASKGAKGIKTPLDSHMQGALIGQVDPRTKYREENQAFLRAKRRLTFRAKAMRIIDHSRRDFMFELDADDRYLRERKGRA